MSLSRKKCYGFTLIEVMAAVSILTFLVTGTVLAIQRGLKTMDSYMQIVTVNQLLTIRQGIDVYAKLYGNVPDSPEALFNRGVLTGSSEGQSGIRYVIKKTEGVLTPLAVYPDGREENIEAVINSSKVRLPAS